MGALVDALVARPRGTRCRRSCRDRGRRPRAPTGTSGGGCALEATAPRSGRRRRGARRCPPRRRPTSSARTRAAGGHAAGRDPLRVRGAGQPRRADARPSTASSTAAASSCRGSRAAPSPPARGRRRSGPTSPATARSGSRASVGRDGDDAALALARRRAPRRGARRPRATLMALRGRPDRGAGEPLDRSFPQYRPGHLDRVDAIDAELAAATPALVGRRRRPARPRRARLHPPGRRRRPPRPRRPRRLTPNPPQLGCERPRPCRSSHPSSAGDGRSDADRRRPSGRARGGSSRRTRGRGVRRRGRPSGR